MPIQIRKGFDVFAVSDEVQINRIGKKILVKTRDGSFTESDSAEANLLYEILKALRKK